MKRLGTSFFGGARLQFLTPSYTHPMKPGRSSRPRSPLHFCPTHAHPPPHPGTQTLIRTLFEPMLPHRPIVSVLVPARYLSVPAFTQLVRFVLRAGTQAPRDLRARVWAKLKVPLEVCVCVCVCVPLGVGRRIPI